MSEVVKVSVVADTSSAKQQLQDLQTQLSNLSAQPINVNDASLVQANKRVIELQQNLQKAMNPNTGKLDLSRFSAELSRSGTQLKDYATALQNLGPQGSQAFLSLSNAIASAEAPTTRLNAKLLKFGQTIKNTINWQISSSIIHGIVGQFQSAINYAEKLNTSLNNIRIVTGASTDKMAEFAKQANQAAQKLSTTTTAYTNASLIYYQQGLGDKEVAARTETTLKLANVSKQSVEEVSNQMTAIWNNYAEGASNLEHYADVITALGAATASSSSEIATGLEKFAAIGKTVGLSYDYATTALATITAETRQSADTVGTGLRTLFSRLQGLKLGETLEDGVSLNKYSAALQTVGVNIQDQYGKVKDMDQILDELGTKWNTISKEQQIALAQTVGGVRQYTNLIALMDNWNTFQKNLKVARGADGTLDKQAQIYEESWDAASKRVRASVESIYSSLLDDKAIVKVIDGFAKFLDIIKGITDGLGGMKGIILTISAIVTQNMAKNMPTYLKDIKFAFKALVSNKDLDKIQSDNLDIIKQKMANQSISEVERAQLNKVYNQQYMNQSLLAHQGRMSKEDIAAYQTRMMLQGMADDARIAEITQQEQAKQAAREQMRAMAGIYKATPITPAEREEFYRQRDAAAAIHTGKAAAANQEINQYQNNRSKLQALSEEVQAFRSNYRAGKVTNVQDSILNFDTRIQELAKEKGLSALGKIPLLSDLYGTDKFQSKFTSAGANFTTDSWISAFIDAIRQATDSLGGLSAEAEKTKATEEAKASEVSSQTPPTESSEREKAKLAAAKLYAEGKGENFDKLSGEAQQKYLDQMGRGIFATSPVYGGDRIRAQAQAEVMARPMQKTAETVGNLYGAKHTFEDLVTGAEKSQKVFEEMSPQQQKEMRASYANTIQGIRKTLLEGGATGEDLKGLDLLGLGKDALEKQLANLDPAQIAAKLQQIKAEVNRLLTGNAEGAEGDGITGGLIGNKLDTLTQQESQFAQATGRTSDADARTIGEANQGIINAAESSYRRSQNPTPTSQLPLAKDTTGLSAALTQTASGLMMLNTALSSASNMVQQFADESSTGLSKFGSALSMITTTMMAAGMAQNGAKSIVAAIGGAGAKAPGWIGLAMAAVTTVIGIIDGVNKQKEKIKHEAYQKQMEAGTAAIENQTKSDELINAQASLINAYKEATKQVLKGSLTQQELQKQQQELINQISSSEDSQYKAAMMGAALSGDANKILQSQREYEIQVLRSNLNNLNSANNSAAGMIGNTDVSMWAGGGSSSYVSLYGYNPITQLLDYLNPAEYTTDEGGLSQWNDNYYLFGSGNANNAADSDNIRAINLVSANSKYFSQGKTADGGVGGLIVNKEVFSSIDDFYYFYKELLEKYEMLQRAGLANTVAGRNMKKQIDHWADDWETISENYQAARDYGIRLGILQSEEFNSRIKDLESYNKVRQELIDKYTEGIEYGSEDYNAIVSSIDNALSKLPNIITEDGKNLSNIYSGLLSIFEGQKKFYNFDLLDEESQRKLEQQMMDSYANLYEHYGDAIFSLSKNIKIPLNFDYENLSPSLKAAFELAQEQSNKNKIQLSMDVVSNFQLNYASSYQEWEDFSKIVNAKLTKDFKETDKTLWEEVFDTKFDIWREFTKTSDELAEEMGIYYSHWNAEYWKPGGGYDTEYSKLLSEKERLEGEERTAYWARDTAAKGVTTAAANASTPWHYRTDDAIPTVGQDLIPKIPAIIQLYNLLETYGIKNSSDASRITEDLLSEDAFSEVLGLLGIQSSDYEAIRNLLRNKDIIAPLVQASTDYDAILSQQQENSAAMTALEQELEKWKAMGAFEDIARTALGNGIDMNELIELARSQELTNKGYQELGLSEKDAAREAQEFALKVLSQRKALEQGKSAIDKYGSALDKFAKKEKDAFDPDVSVGLVQIKKSLKQLYGGDLSDYTDEFIQANWDKIKQVMSGDIEAFYELSKQLIGERLPDLIDKAKLTDGETVSGIIEELQAAFDADKGITIGTTIDLIDSGQVSEYMTNLQALFDANKIDMNDMIDLAAAGGWEPITKEVPVGTDVDANWKQGGVVYAVSADGNAIPVPLEGETTVSGDTDQTYNVITGWQKTGPGGGAPKGGGGGGGKKKKKDHKKPDIGTRYHKIKAKQANNEQNKSEVSRKKERAFGAEKIKQAEKEIELQKEAIELQRQYVDEINDYLAEDRTKMIEAFTPDKLGFDLGFNLEIDENGVITNYRQLEEKLLKEENKLIDKYNEGGLDDEAYEEAQKKIDEAREYLKIYEETRDLYEEEWIKLGEYLDSLADSALELTKLKIDLDISISDDALGLLDYMLEKIEDNAYKAAEAISLLGDKTNETLKRVDIYQSGLEEILNSKGLSLDDLTNITDEQLINGDFTQAQIDQIREWRDAILDADKELLQMREDIIDKIIDAFNELNDKVQESYDQFDNYNSIIEDYTNITDLLAIRLNQQQKELIKMLGQAALNNAQTQAAAARTIYEEALANQQAAQKAYEQAVANGDTEAMRQWEKVVKETQTVLDDAQQQWLEAWQAALEKAQELYTKAIEDTVKAFEESVSGAFGTLDYLQSAFDRMGQTNDQYLQDFEKLYELNKLNRDIQNAIDDTTNIRDKQALRDLQKEINHLQEEGIELSQYDVDALRKKFELEQARLALEDARNAKSEVRLQRDANGNWGYVYTAKEDEVAKAEQEYEDKLYEYQKLNDEYITELQSRVLETQTTYKEALAEIYNDTTLTDAQREARINELNNWLQAELSYFEQQLNNAMDNQQGTLDLYYNKYNNAQAKLADSWDETTLRMLTGANSVAEYMDNVKKSVEDMLQSSSEALSQYNKDVDETNHMAGVETEDYEKEVSDAITTIGKDSAKTREEVAKLSEELKDNFVDSLKEAINWEEEYANKINAAVDANENFIKSINEMIAKLAELESSNPGLEKARTAYQAAELAHEEYVQEWKRQHPDEDVVEADIVDEAWEKAKAEWQKYLEEVVGISPIYDTGVPQSLKTGGYTGRWSIASAKTGMYTGSWAGADVEENGRLAFLHQKELVLNADDTQNFLDATQILRTIDLSTNMFSKGLGNIITPWIGDMRQQDLEQNVHIEASFPNVTEHNEIERAFDNLINRAAQYVNRK